MKLQKGLTLAAMGVALVLAAQATAGGRTVSKAFTVEVLAVPGASTGIMVTDGLVVTVTATGAACPFGVGGYCVGPDGNASQDTTTSPYDGWVLPGAPAWGLVGRVGSGPWVQVGSGPTTLTGTGVLQFAMNDDLFVDNAGGFAVTVSYTCWPGWGYGDKNHVHCGPPGQAKKSPPSETASTAHGSSNAHGNTSSNGHGNSSSSSSSNEKGNNSSNEQGNSSEPGGSKK
jgi:hypothetical protein